MSSVSVLLDRLEKVRQTAPDKWQARCPAHEDRSPSLSVREADDGTILLKCWTGCGAAEVVGAVGLELRDLFPERAPEPNVAKGRRRRSPWVPRDALQALATDALFVSICAEDMAKGQALDDDTRSRLATAGRRFLNAYAEVAR
jgi:hypothetical protein